MERFHKLKNSPGILIILLVLFLCASGSQARAEAPSAKFGKMPPKMIQFQHLTVKDGLSNSQAMGIAQDRQGFMWFATANGLNRYDGYTFTRYQVNPDDPSDPRTVSAEVIVDLRVDHLGVLWATTFGGGLNRYDHQTDRFVHFRHDPHDPESISSDVLTWLTEDQSGDLWIGTAENGLNRWVRQSDRFIRYQHVPHDPESIGSNNITSVFEDRRGRLWVGVEKGVDRYDRANNRFIHYTHDPDDSHSLPHGERWHFYEDHLGTLWIGSRKEGGGLVRYESEKENENENERFIHYTHDPNDPYSIADNTIRSIFEDSLGRLWFGTGTRGVDVYDREHDRFLHYRHDPYDPGSLIHDMVYYMFEDRSQVLWLSTFGGGISRYDLKSERFEFIRHDPSDQNSLSENNIFGIFEDSRGHIWLGSFGSGLNRYDPRSGRFTRFRHDPSNPASISDDTVFWITEDDDGFLWLGTRTGGLNSYDPATGLFRHYKHLPGDPTSITENDCQNVLYAGNNELWVSHGNGVSKFDIAKQTFTQYPHVGHYNTIMFKDSTGDIWFGGGMGVYRYDREQDRFEKHGITTDVIHAMHEDGEGNFWLGWGGIRKYDRNQGRFTEHYDTDDGLMDNSVTGILEDRSGNLWIATSRGLSCFDAKEKRFKNYSAGTFNLKSYYRSRSGRLYFGGTHGVTAFFPEDIVDNPHKPAVVLTSFKKFNTAAALETPLTVLRELRLTHQDRFFSFEFAALDYADPSINRYKYMLEGFDRDWIHVESHRRYAGYTNLNEGIYRFKVRGSNNDGVWNETGVDLNIHIEPDPAITPHVYNLADPVVGEITLPYHDNSLSLEIVPLDFTLLGKALAYKLEGYDSDWVDAENHRFVHYTHLNPGRYRFKTKGYLTREVPIRIRPPFWRTWWFFTMVAMGIAGLSGLFYSQRIRHLKAQNQARLLGKEMELARQIQTAILPKDVSHDELEIASAMITADRVGGDFYDILYSEDGALWIAIGDVSGHGVTPGLIMMMAQTVHTTIATHYPHSPREVINTLNKVLCRNVRGRLGKDHFMTFTTLKYGGRGKFEYAGAHLSMVHYRQSSRSCELIRTPGTFLNLIEDISESTQNASLALKVGDMLVLYSDGLTEARNQSGELLDIQRFMDIVGAHAAKEIQAMQEAVIKDVLTWCDRVVEDDMSLVVVRRVR